MFIKVDRAIQFAGNKNKLANMLKISRQAVGQWEGKKYIPQEQAIKLVEEFGEKPFR